MANLLSRPLEHLINLRLRARADVTMDEADARTVGILLDCCTVEQEPDQAFEGVLSLCRTTTVGHPDQVRQWLDHLIADGVVQENEGREGEVRWRPRRFGSYPAWTEVRP